MRPLAGDIWRAIRKQRCSRASPTSGCSNSINRVHLVAGFGRIVDLEAPQILTRIDDARELVDAEPEILAHLNGDHADTVRLYAVKLLGGEDGPWQCVGFDPEGIELQLGRRGLRLPFPIACRRPGACGKC